ncbi:MAG: MBOAT family protein [Planctomycetes bacterium]|nr:MBOAT family protein [Planctomycetota bacterium]
MQFTSIDFILFFVLFMAVWPLTRRSVRLRWAYLTVASLVFYGWWDWRFLFLIAASGLVDFAAGLAMEAYPRRRTLWLVGSVLANVASLAVFKYLDFFIANFNGLGALLGADWALPAGELILPVGISFYTFQSMSYTIDVYRGQLKPTRSVLQFFAYLALFPQLVAGPIVRASDLLPQLERVRPTTEAERFEGLRLVVYGFFKKMVVADTLAPIVTGAFSGGTVAPDAAYWWLIMAMFAYQIYCDFSGYSDIARGLGRWLGFDFPLNFDHPYIAAGFRDFWTRWHISLSTWFRDYVYVPLGGSRSGAPMGHRNLWITMLVSGLWHGASWTFVLWGAIHAALLSLERLTAWPRRVGALPGGRLAAVALTFAATLVAWVFFRAESLAQAVAVVGRMFSFAGGDTEAVRAVIREHRLAVYLVVAMMLRHLWFGLPLPRGAENETQRSAPVRLGQAVALGALVAACVFMRGPGSAFIYFQF